MRFHFLWSTLPVLVAWPLSAVAQSTDADGGEKIASPVTADPAAPPLLTFDVHVHGRYLLGDGEPSHRFEIRRARLAVTAKPLPWLKAQVDADAAHAPSIRDAFVNAEITPWLELRLGQFKKPMSRIELTPSRRLPLWNRGIVNDRLIDDNDFAFGGRDLGVMAHGEVGELGYALGAFNGNGRLQEIDDGKDVAARVTYSLAKTAEVGASGALKWRDEPGVDRPHHDFWAAGVDGRVRLWLVELVGETLWGQSARGANRPQTLGASLLAILRLKLTDVLRLRPLIKAELLDDDTRRNHDLAWSLLAGANLHVGDSLRIMLQGEQTLPQRQSVLPREWRCVLQIAFDTELSVAGIR